MAVEKSTANKDNAGELFFRLAGATAATPSFHFSITISMNISNTVGKWPRLMAINRNDLQRILYNDQDVGGGLHEPHEPKSQSGPSSSPLTI